MDLKDKAKIKEKISLDIIKINRKIEELKEFTQPVEPDCAIGRISRMDAINNKSVFDASMRNSLERRRHLEISLKLIEEKGFGLCIKCGVPIPMDRLLIRPEVRLCINCMAK